MGAPDNFEILSELGEGAFARVYRAREKTSGKQTALKILKEGFVGAAEIIERFRREVFAVASIDSPHVVKLHDFGMSGSDVFIAMEYVHGPTLRELVRGRPWSAEAARVVVGQIAQALSAAHAQGIVHRDLKPENVMLVRRARGRQVKVLDFGLAKLVAIERKLELEPLTQAGMCFGTPQYMAPEQMRGRPASQSADLFALAVIAYEMLSGRLPWDGGDPREVFGAVLTTPPPSLERVHPSVSPQRAALDGFFTGAL
ncbi:MAG TPA: serine/threonine-protein kinase, partial [Polyangia bacterium]|nr:serine/threonine-protein kinase [Polyangia bacterium]